MEAKTTAPAGARWRKSTRSGGGEHCVELAGDATFGAVRDSKNADGPAIVLRPEALGALLDVARRA